MSRDHLIPRHRQVPHHELMLGIPGVQQRFEVSGMLHPIGQRIAHDREVIARSKRERFHRRRGLRATVKANHGTEQGAEEQAQSGRSGWGARSSMAKSN